MTLAKRGRGARTARMPYRVGEALRRTTTVGDAPRWRKFSAPTDSPRPTHSGDGPRGRECQPPGPALRRWRWTRGGGKWRGCKLKRVPSEDSREDLRTPTPSKTCPPQTNHSITGGF